MYFYTHVLPRRVIDWLKLEIKRAKITFNLDRK